MPEPQWNREVAYELFESEGGPAGDLMRRLGVEVAVVARARCRRRTGRTADLIHSAVGTDSQGLYVDVGTKYVGNFLEHPAKQMKRAYPFLTDGLNTLAGRRE